LSRAVLLLVLVAIAAHAWECPRCSSVQEGEFCSVCGLLEPPEAMIFIPACTVEIEGIPYDVDPFYIDSIPVTYRDVLPWMEEVVASQEDLAAIVTGQFDENFQFLSFTPFINNEEGTALTVPTSCFGIPAASFTWEGALLFLNDNGKHLPTAAQLMAAREAGVIQEYDVYSVMQSYSSVMTASMGNLLGTLGNQSMFAGYSTAAERVMWEWARDEWSHQPGSSLDMLAQYRILWKPLDPPVIGAAGRDAGYFNVIFRGVVLLPMEWQ
jgi:hypothetical protein